MKNILKYPGSKWRIAKQLLEYIPPHHSYVEPFFGSGAVLFNKAPSNIETVNDLDSDVANLFRCIQQDSERLARLVMTIPFSREEYDRQFDPDFSGYEDQYHKAAGFLVKLWQAHGSRNDGYKAGWKYDIAGRERAYSLWYWYKLPEWIIDIAERLRRVQIENRPAIEVIQKFDHEKVFQYWDPPYLLKTINYRRKKQYRHEMTDAGHEELLGIAVRSKARIMISGYESDMYNDYLKGWNKAYFKTNAEGGGKRQEVIWMNYGVSRQINFMEYIQKEP